MASKSASGSRSWRGVDEVDERAAARHVLEEAVAEPGALVRALDQPGEVGEHEAAAVLVLDHAEVRHAAW